MSIYKKLREAQNDLKAPKTEPGRFGKSRSAELILEHAKPVLKKHGLTLVVTDEILSVGDRNYVKATAVVYDDDGNTVSATANAWEGSVDRGLDASQVTGKTSSYARKYAMGGLLAIDDTKDADMDKETATVKNTAKVQELDDPVTPTQKQQLKNTMSALEMGNDSMVMFIEDTLGKQSVETYSDFQEVLEKLEAKDDKRSK